MNQVSSSPWTSEQLNAIDDRGHDLLVSAAAGSGKTAVLTERVIRLITGTGPFGDHPIPLEELLVITFTRKAAREMRERIEQKIMKGLEENPNDRLLRSALDVLPRANVSTLHAFCDRIVRRHFHLARVAPNVRLADEDEEREILQTAARKVFEELSLGGEIQDSEPNEAVREFAYLVAATSPGFGHGGVLESLAARVDLIRSFAASLENPVEWKLKVRLNFEASLKAKSIDELPDREMISGVFAQSFAEVAETFVHLCDQAQTSVAKGCVPEEWKRICGEFQQLVEWLKQSSEHSLSSKLHEIEEWLETNSKQLEKLKNQGICGPTLYAANDFRSQVLEKFSDKLARWRKDWFSIGLEHQLPAAQLAARQGLALLNLADRVEEQVQEIKRRRGVIGFQDVERKALEVLTDPSGGISEVASQYQEFFKHVLVDEYQDISPLQDAIIRRLSHTDDPLIHVERNLFIVGDLKQSIYRFRRAEPRLFAQRLDQYSADGTGNSNRRIDLKTNFRSRPGILEAVNAVFERLMDRSIGDIDYDQRAKLYPHRLDPEHLEPISVEAHWILQDPSEADDLEPDEELAESEDVCGTIEREAQWIAHLIRKMTDEHDGAWIHDTATNQPRRARPGDCAILVRRLNTELECWVSTLSRHGIKLQATGRKQLLLQTEIIDLLNALRLAENPFQDIPLASVLRSPMVSLSESEMLRLRMVRRHGPFHQAVWAAMGREKVFQEVDSAPSESTPQTQMIRLDYVTEPLRRKLESFFAKLDRWRFLAALAEAEDVLHEILTRTRYEAHLAGLPDGRSRLGNVDDLRRMMRDRAGQVFGASSLTDFLRFISDFDRGPGPDEEREESREDHDTVRLLTVHKSKGLEFPIVFLPRLASPFGGMVNRDDLEMDAEKGMTLAAVDPERRLRLRPLALTAMRADEARHSRAEELRLLYVAMTRARDRLIFLGTSRHWKSADQLKERWRHSPIAHDRVIPTWIRLKAQSPADLLAPLLTRLENAKDSPWLHVAYEQSLPSPKQKIELPVIRQALANFGENHHQIWEAARKQYMEVFASDERASEICESLKNAKSIGAGAAANLIFISSTNAGLSRVPPKIYASQLRRDAATGKLVWQPDQGDIEELATSAEEGIAGEAIFPRPPQLAWKVPSFALGEESIRLDPVSKGILTHALLQHVNLAGNLDEDGLRVQARELWGRGLLDVEKVELLEQLPYGNLERFFCSRLGQGLVSRPGSVLRELPFRRWIHPSDIHERGSDGSLRPLAPPDCPERILLQGVIDCVIDFGNEAVLLDYKTDHVGNEQDLIALKEKYIAQIGAYRQALRTIWRIPVTETYLAFLSAGKNVLVEDSLE